MPLLKQLFSRPIASLMGWAAIVLLGFISWQKLPIDLLPKLEYPQITIVVKYPNASPEEIENLLVKPVESAISGVQRLVRLESRCREDTGFIHAFFDWGSSMDFAALAVREKIDLIRDKLPKEADAPVVMKYSPFALPALVLSVTGPLSADDLTQYVTHTLKAQLEKVEGVAQVQVRGGTQKEIHVEVLGNRLAATDKSLLSVAEGLRDANINYPAGSIESRSSEYLLRTIGEFKNPKEIGDLPLPQQAPALEDETPLLEKAPLYTTRATLEQARTVDAPAQRISEYRDLKLKDIARVSMSYKPRTSFSRHNGLENVSVAIYKQSDAPTTEVVRRVQNTLRFLRGQAPQGVAIETVFDQSRFIRAAFRSVGEALILGALLTLVVLYTFLRNLRDSLVIFLSIPCCLLGTALAMYFTGVSLNMISLGGLALAIGMLVDNSIVVIENIHRHRQEGEDPLSAALNGTHEVLSAVSSSTFAHIVVFLPMIYLTGVAGQMFRDLALTISFGLLFSLGTAIALTPLFFLGAGPVTFNPREIQFSYDSLQRVYSRLFARRGQVFWACGGAFAVGIGIFLLLPKELLPKLTPRQWTIQARLPIGTNVATTNEKLSILEKHLLSLPPVQSVSLLIGAEKDSDISTALAAMRSNEGEFLIELREHSRTRPQDVMEEIQEWIGTHPIPGLLLHYDLQKGLLAVGAEAASEGITSIHVHGNELDSVSRSVRGITDTLDGMEGISQVHSSLVLGSPEARLTIPRKTASAHNVSVKDIAATMKIAVEGIVPTTFKAEAYPIDVRVSLAPEDAADFQALGEIRIPSADGAFIPLKKVAQLVRSSGPMEILRVDKQRTAIVSFLSKNPRAQKRALRAIRKIDPGSGVTVSLGGQRQFLVPALRELFFALGLSLVLLFMILAAQFESILQPFLILLTVPLSILGVGLALVLSGQSLNSVCLLGMVVMGGIVVNNGILYVTVANDLLRQRMDPVQAAVKAAHLRLRPILMTSLTTVLGMLPMAVGLGEGAELNSPLAVVVIGGMLSSTPLVLGFLPCLFTLLSPRVPARAQG